MSVVRRRLLIEGRVQGVYYRASCKAEAVGAGVAGWVANRPDGRVEAVLEGGPEAVARVERWCRSGPPHARVTAVHGFDEAPAGAAGFTVR